MTEEIASIEAEISEKVATVKKLQNKSKTNSLALQSQFSCAIQTKESASSETAGETRESPVAFLHLFLKQNIKEVAVNGDQNNMHQNSNLIKSAKLRIDHLKELLVRKSLAKAHQDEVITDIQICETRSAITATSAKANAAVDKLEDSLNSYEVVKVWNEMEIKTKTTQLDAAQKYLFQCKEVLQLNPTNAGAKVEVENAGRARDEAKIELESTKRSSELCSSITSLSYSTFQLLDLTVAVGKLEASMETGMLQKSSARVFSELALLRKQQWMDGRSDVSGGLATEARYLVKLALLKDEHKEMKTSACHFSDDNLLDLHTWSKMMTAVVTAEQELHSFWIRYAAEQSSLTPNNASVRAAEKHLETVLSDAKQVILSSVQEHSTRKLDKDKAEEIPKDRAKENALVKTTLAKLMKGRKSASISSVVRDLAEASLTVAQHRLENANCKHEDFPEIDSANYLNMLDAAISELPQPK